MTDPNVVHVYPAANDPEHVLDAGTCWCQPVLDYIDPVTGGRLWVHRSSLDSPHYEVARLSADGDSPGGAE